MIKGVVRWKRLGESVQRVFSPNHESKCSSQKTDPRECEGYLYPPKCFLWRRPSVKKWPFFHGLRADKH